MNIAITSITVTIGVYISYSLFRWYEFGLILTTTTTIYYTTTTIYMSTNRSSSCQH